MRRRVMARQRSKYPREFKLELLRQIEEGKKTASELCRELGVSPQQVSGWRRQLAVKGEEAFPGQGQKRGAAAELAELRKENERLREENEILKKAAAYFARDVR
jgi:transposase